VESIAMLKGCFSQRWILRTRWQKRSPYDSGGRLYELN